MTEQGLEESLAALDRAGFDVAEVYSKRGRSRRLDLENGDVRWVVTQEEGWAVRAGDRHGSFFCCGSGPPRPDFPWPSAAAGSLRLPEPASAPPWSEPDEITTPFYGESEARGLLEAIARDLGTELPLARLARATLEEGTSESALASSRGVEAAWRGRAAILRIEAVSASGEAVTVHLAERQAASFRPANIARRLADRLLVAQSGAPPDRDRGEFLLSPAVGIRLLEGFLPLLVGPRASARAQRLRDRQGRIGARPLTIVDDGRLPGGALEAPVDGEGVATREVVLVEEGMFRQPLLSWRSAKPPQERPSGCTRRASWRDVPQPGPTHLYVRPQPQVAVASLLGALARGYYLLDATAALRFDGPEERFALPVCGFAVQGGRAFAPVAGAWLCGSIGGFLRGVEAVARDLVFLPLDGMLGAPTLLVAGLEIRREPPF